MSTLPTFDFDAWARLAQSDPEAFERKRAQVIETAIRSGAPRNWKRLRGLQFQVDAQRRLSSHPLGACIRMSRMMLQMFYDEFVPALNGQLPARRAARSGHVIPFRRRG
ncbi:MAG TPA: DUF3135 domain-containing protein [Chromatiales bacterium]|nr:DUF3135 domain-containing protein [Chromatiales bacterium]